MVVTLDDTKRISIAAKLADLKALQNLLINNEQQFIQDCLDEDICKRLQDMVESDRKNLGIIETVIIQYGVPGEPKESTQKIIEQVQKLMKNSELTLFEKVSQHELLKHQQTMTGLLIHKAAQVVGADIQAAIAPLNTVNFENRAHQEQLKGILEILGVRQLTGQEPDQGLWGRVQDAIAALSGVVASVATRLDDEMSILDLLRMDHTKTDILLVDILGSNDPQKIQEYFGQLYKDVQAHGAAEEQVVYPAVRPYYQDTQELYAETADVKRMLDEIKSMNPSDSEFKAKVEQLMMALQTHISQEENEMFPKIRDNFSHQQHKQMATEFKTVKSKLQVQIAAANK